MKKSPSLSTFCSCAGLGIDVSKGTLDVVGIKETQVWHHTLGNEQKEITQLAHALVEGGYRGKIVCESTGHYHLLLALIFCRYGLDLRVVNPLLSHKHQQGRVRKTKTDPQDGYVLATMCLTERDLPATVRMDEKKAEIRLKQGRLHSLEKQLQRLRQSVAAYEETYQQLGLPLTEPERALHEAANELERIRKRLQRELDALLAAAVQESETIAELQALPGFSRNVAGLVGVYFDRQAPNANAWVAYSGMDVSVRQSGTWRGKGRLTKRGNGYLRKRLFHAAWGASMNYDYVKRYYDELKSRGRNHVEALCIIARKLLRIAYTILTKKEKYDPKVAFAGYFS